MANISNFSNLTNGGDRRIRDVVNSNGQRIEIYEPRKEDIKAIIDMQDRAMVENEDGQHVISLTGAEIIRGVFPLLTDVEGIDDLSDEELEEIVENPSIAFLTAQHTIEGIVTEIAKMVILQMKNRLLEQDLELETVRNTSDILERVLDLGHRDNKTEEVVNKIEKTISSIVDPKVEFSEEEKQEVKTVAANIEKEMDEKVVDFYSGGLAKYKNSFGD